MIRPVVFRIAVLLALTGGGLTALTACEGCRSAAPASSASGPAITVEVGPPTLLLYLVTDMAGALEPCGCTKDQLGGLGHLGAWIQKSRAFSPVSLVAAAG
ncbi:MAG: hypothetical protein ACREJ3_15025, partial [Polyangiaceae bacterium]